MLVLKSIEIKNFRSFGNSPVTYEFKNGMTLIKGHNREGKSSTMMAITYVLFGKIKNIKINELINSTNSSNLLVKLIFEKNNIEYKIIRGDSPKIFEIYKNNVKIESNNRIQTEQELLERDILGISYDTYTRLISLDSTLIAKSFFTMSKSQRKNFLEEILDIKILYYLLLESKARYNIVSTNKVEKEYQYKNIINAINQEKKHIAEIKKINEDLKNSRNFNIDKINSNIIEYNNKIKELKILLQDIEEYTKEYNTLKTEIFNLNIKKSNLIKEGKKLTTLFKKKTTLKKTFINCIGCSKLDSIVNIKIDDDTINNVKSNITGIKQSVQEVISDIEVKQNKINDLEKKINNKYNIQSNIDKYKSLIIYNEDELVKIKEYTIWKEDTYKLDNYIEEKNQIQEELRKIEKDRKSLEIINELVSDNGIKKQIFIKYIPLFNMYLNKYLEKFGIPYNIVFNEIFEVKILERGIERNYMSFSGSEKLRLSLAVIFSFIKLVEARNSFSINILLLDELVDSALSNDNVGLILDFLKYNFNNKEIITISHRQLDKEFFDQIYEIKKENNFTKITKGE